jgi:hypothetical protein
VQDLNLLLKIFLIILIGRTDVRHIFYIAAVTPVRKVSACGKAAYAIVTAETIESGRFITTGRLSQASPQQIIDCSNGTGNKGCTSGNILNSF